MSCLQCKAKVEPTTDKLGCCTKCKMQQLILHCRSQLTAKVVIANGNSYHTLNVFSTNVSDIAQIEKVTVESLLCAPPFTLTYENNVVTAIGRA